MLTKEEDGHLA